MNDPRLKRISCANSETIAPPAGHYSHICTAGGLVYISGQLPVTPGGRALADRPFIEQAQQVLSNVESCLAQAGVDKNSLVQVRVYVTDIKNWPLFNEVYGKWIGEHRPARAVAGVSELHYELAVEVEAVALARD
ncbi:MAG TPA: RidA family protein [Steroidobacteraceae bacterium]|nr:RidA family protein [Steroidobacteraceae bacterium]